jgi:hypothetical protein
MKRAAEVLGALTILEVILDGIPETQVNVPGKDGQSWGYLLGAGDLAARVKTLKRHAEGLLTNLGAVMRQDREQRAELRRVAGENEPEKKE